MSGLSDDNLHADRSAGVMRPMDQRRRDLESCLDQIAESTLATDGDVSIGDVPLTIADDLISYAAAYARFPPPKEVTHGHAVWLETRGKFRGIWMLLRTAERRRRAAA